MKSQILPAFCTSGRKLVPAGIVVHYFSGRNVDPDRQFDLDVCRRLFIDLNRPRELRRWYMTDEAWPAKRMYASAHLLIGRDGETWKLTEYDRQAYHAGKSILNGRRNCNAFTLGIELVGTISSGFSREQYSALAEIVVDLQTRYGIPRDAIAGHDQVRWAAIQAGEAEKKKYDPSGRYDGTGDNFDWWYLGKLCNDLRGVQTDPEDPALEQHVEQVLEASQGRTEA